MKYILIALGLVLSVPAFAGVNVSIHVGEPAFFGRIDIAGGPPPLLLAPRPVIIAPPGVSVNLDPLYLHVRPEESRNWRRYCHRYDACGRQVYFVKDNWYRNVYVPHYHSHHDEYVRRENERAEHDRMERDRIEHERMEHERHERHDNYRDDHRDDRRDYHDNDRRDHDDHHDHSDDHGPDHDRGYDHDHDRDHDHDHH